MRAATERTRLVDETIASGIEQWTTAGWILRQHLAAGRAQGLGSDERFAFRQIRSAASQLEMAAFLYADTISVDRARREIGIDLANFVKSGVHARS
jgi:hypothetical protein